MIDLYRRGTTARQVAKKFRVSLRSVKPLLPRLLKQGHTSDHDRPVVV